MITCEICGKEFKNTQGLRGHKNFVHSNGSSTDSATQTAAESQLSKLEVRLEKLEYITGLAEMNALKDILSNDKPLTEKITEVTEQLNHLTQQLTNFSSNTASNGDLHNINERVSQLTQQLSNFNKRLEPVGMLAGTISRLEDELRSKAQNTRVNATENRLRCLEEESNKTEKIIEKCFNMNTAYLDTQLTKVVEAIRNVVDTLANAVKKLQDQVREQKQVTDWVKKEYNLRTVQKVR